ncbi:DNA polymerase alpha catalytic subunit-like [Lethenteron reissneri]|uniref:DNA polymerase alpha catalytic subunit-like n=1 Tax=Lethenteron reissneri TaxID=7753 RepID=UPI002AB7ED38|nr:DNA polymerase alpha catalytic subunit-like [Lethenteron reissneri]
MPRLGGRRVVERLATCGRVVCDVKTSARELVRCRSYDLDELVASLLRTKRETFSAESVAAAYANSQRLLDMASHTLTDAARAQHHERAQRPAAGSPDHLHRRQFAVSHAAGRAFGAE